MKKLATFLFLFFSLVSFAVQPTGYYTTADGKNVAALRTALQSIITNGHSVTSYSGLWTAYATTDENSSGKIWDIYSNCTFNYSSQQCGSYSAECDCYNREHTSPQSWFNSASPMVSDLFNVYPTDGKVNGERSNYVYGEVASPTYTSANGSKLGPSSFAGYTGIAFEPVNEYKGDIARTYFYMATRYAGLCESWSSGAEVVYSTSNLGFTPYAMNLFLKWSREDPVSAKEIARNEAVYGIQNNRNPFIDYPGLEEYIWGNKTNTTFSINGTSTPYISSPSAGTTVDFGKVAYQQTDTATVYIKGMNLTSDLNFSLSGTNAGYFSLPVSGVSFADAQAGYKLVVSYSAQALGSHTATLTISGDGISAVTVTLNATATDSFLALAATNITSTGFTANWTSSAGASGYTLDVFSLTGSAGAIPKTLLEEDFATGIPTTWTKTGYTDTTTPSNVRMGSGSQGGQISTPVTDMSTATTLVVRAKEYGTDASAKLTVKVNADSVAGFLTGAANQDFTVNIPAKTSTSTVSLSVLSGSGHRVYVDYVKLSTQGIVQTPVSVSGYPSNVGNVLTYSVTGLQSDSTYYYTVTPQGNSTTVSDKIKVHTALANSITELPDFDFNYKIISGEGLEISGIPENCSLTISDLLGKQIKIKNASPVVHFKLSQKGLYLLQLQRNQEFRTYKIIY